MALNVIVLRAKLRGNYDKNEEICTFSVSLYHANFCKLVKETSQNLNLEKIKIWF